MKIGVAPTTAKPMTMLGRDSVVLTEENSYYANGEKKHSSGGENNVKYIQ